MNKTEEQIRKKSPVQIRNKKASFEYFFIDTYTAGIVLTGTEIKSIRLGKASLVDTYCVVINGELWVKGMNVSPYFYGSYNNHEAKRDRKLLLTKKEIRALESATKQTGYTIVPILVFIDEKGRAKTAVNSNDYRMIQYRPDEYISKTLYKYWADNYAEAGSNYRVQNINITLSSDNDDIEGPNFCNPSATAGCDGYNEAADWSRARLNNLTDNGSTFLSQDVIDAGPDGFIVSWQRRSDESYEGDVVRKKHRHEERECGQKKADASGGFELLQKAVGQEVERADS